MVILDANFLLLMLDPGAGVPRDPISNQPISRIQERIEFLFSSLSQQRETIGIPTPVLAEVLVYAGQAGAAYISKLVGSSHFRILPFDLRAAVEVAAMTHSAIAEGDKKSGSTSSWQKVKIDRQIVAISVIEKASAIYSDDQDILGLSKLANLQAHSTWALPLPPEPPQMSLSLEPRDA